MALIKFVFLFILLLGFPTAFAGEIEVAYKNKNYKRVTEIYRTNRDENFTQLEIIMISSSLRKQGFFRQEIKMNLRIIKRRYLADHRKLLKAIKAGDTIDGDEYKDGQKLLYWNILTAYAIIIKGYSKQGALLDKDVKTFNSFYQILSELEFRSTRVDKTNDLVSAHIQYLQDKIYRSSVSFSFSFVSWQKESTLLNKGTGEQVGLILTNKGYCIGGDAGIENRFYHFYVDGCFLYGSGSVSAFGNNNIKYQQSSVPAFGVKVGPGASMLVGSSRSRIGFKLPLIYTAQSLAAPKTAGWLLDEGSALQIMPAIYGRWHFDKWYFQTEFGQYLQKEESFWSLGFGRAF